MRDINIWNKEGFQMCGLRSKCRLLATIKHIAKCIKWSWQRVVRGYAECDKWSIYDYLQMLIPDMLQDLRQNRMGSSSCFGEDYVNSKGILVNDTCHEEWNRILDRMIFLWREAKEETCTMKNPYEEEYMKAFVEFKEKYGTFGEKLQIEAERKRTRETGARRVHYMDEVPEYKEIYDKHYEEERKIERYREKSQGEALDMLKEYFYYLWD